MADDATSAAVDSVTPLEASETQPVVEDVTSPTSATTPDELTKWKERSARLGAAVTQQKQRIHELEESDAKLKRLLNLAKRSIENKDATLESLKQQINDLKSAAKAKEKDPRRIIHKVKHVSHTGQETVWCLVEYTSDDDDDSRPPECGWHSFKSEDEVLNYVHKAAGEPIRVPELSLPPSDIQQMKQELSDELERVQEEFRRYRVRSEITRKQKEAELRKLSATTLAKQTEQLGGIDLQQELQAARMQEREWKEKYEKLERDYTKLSGAMGETVLAMEWRSRYEQAVQEKAALEQRLNDDSFNLANDLDGGNDLAKVKMEFALYRKRAMQVVEQKEKELQQARAAAPSGFSSAGLRRMSSSNSLNGFETSVHAPTTNEYLKNIVMKYMSTDQEEVKEHMEKAIATVLNFSAVELQHIQDKRKSHSGWLW
ncbi:unnamed protein product [Aphanomyces euteiches]